MEERMGILSKPGDQEVCCDTVSPRVNGEVTPIILQQSSCPNKTRITTVFFYAYGAGRGEGCMAQPRAVMGLTAPSCSCCLGAEEYKLRF